MKSGVGWERTTRQKTIGELLLLYDGTLPKASLGQGAATAQPGLS
jgi:hypothetical protein